MFSFSFYQTTPILYSNSIVMCICVLSLLSHSFIFTIKYWAYKMNIKFIRETKLNIIIFIHQWFYHFRTAFSLSVHPFSFVSLFLFVLRLCWGTRLFSTPDTSNSKITWFFCPQTHQLHTYQVCLSSCMLRSFSIYDLLRVHIYRQVETTTL